VFYPGSAETNAGWGENLSGPLIASCVRNIRTKNYQNLIIGFQVTVRNVGDVFLRHSVVNNTNIIDIPLRQSQTFHFPK